jgi:hypothetical protein
MRRGFLRVFFVIRVIKAITDGKFIFCYQRTCFDSMELPSAKH